MFNIKVDLESKVAVYKQLVEQISSAVRDGRLKSGEIVPSMNVLSDELGISKETVKRAYGILRHNGVLDARQGKGFYVADSKREEISVLFLIDKFSIYKQEIVRGFHQAVKKRTEDTILLFNQDIKVFEYFLNENLGKFDYYVVSPHFSLDEKVQEQARRLLRRIPNHKLILVDRMVHGLQGNYGAAYQDFENDVYSGLMQGIDKFTTVKKLKIITLPTSLYGPVINKRAGEFCKDNSIVCDFYCGVPDDIEYGDVFLILNSQLDSGLIALVDKANSKGMTVGKDYFIISYNDSPVDRVVLNGLTTISTDFVKMGEEAAAMVNDRTMRKTHIEFKMNKRNTF